MKDKLMKLFRDLMKFGKVETPEGVLIYEGETLTEGTEVYVESDGEIIPAPDGQYGEYKVVEGKIAPAEEPVAEPETPAEEEVKEEEIEPETETEATPDEKDEKIAELEAKIAELEAKIAEYEKKEEEAFAALQPAEKEIKDVASKAKVNGAMKYFDK